MKNYIFATTLSLFAFAVLANASSPYQGQDSRDIKALSQQQVEAYLKGKGLGYAKAAELNQYPGPSHVLEAAKELKLTQQQIIKTQAIFNNMQTQAARLGKQYVEKEKELDRQFASESIDSDSLKSLLSDIGALQANIRYVHLSAHIEQKSLLSKHQIHVYDQLRGYEATHNGGHSQSHQ